MPLLRFLGVPNSKNIADFNVICTLRKQVINHIPGSHGV